MADVVAVGHANVRAQVREIVADLRRHRIAVDILDNPRAFSPELFERSGAGVLLASTALPLDARSIAGMPNLHTIVFVASGTNSVDLDAATNRGIVVAHAPVPENIESVAEATIALMLALLLDLPRSQRRLAGGWLEVEMPYARSLWGKTVGLIGAGRVGRGVAQRLSAWSVRLLFTARSAHADVPGERVPLERLLAESDVVSVHVPLDAGTEHLLDERAIRSMRRGAVLVNTSRGGIVDESAVARALTDGHLGGAAFDVFSSEPVDPANPLLHAPQAILTPHCVGHTVESFEAIVNTGSANVRAALAGETPLYVRNSAAIAAWRRTHAAPALRYRGE